MKKFKINNYITLKLEDGTTNLYVNGELFRQCKLLLLNISINEDFSQVQSIDEIAEKMGWTPLGQMSPHIRLEIRKKISPVTEFWAHCSNIQAWVEDNYNPNILHHSLAFPLLRKLAETGDLQAKARFKEDVAKRLESSTPQVMLYLIQERYLEIFTKEELESLILNIDFNNPSEDEYLKYVPSIFTYLYDYNLSNKVKVILFEHLAKQFYGNLFEELKQILLKKYQKETQILLDKLSQGIKNTNLRRIKEYFYFFNMEEKIKLFREALSSKFFHVLFELLTENPSLIDHLEKKDIPILVKEAFMTGNPSVISLLEDEGHLIHLSHEQIEEIMENISSFGLSKNIIAEIEDWYSWLEKGYVRFRSCYIYRYDVQILQEIERVLNIKLIYTPHDIALSNYMFEIDDEGRVSKLFITDTIKRKLDIPDSLVERIYTLENLKELHMKHQTIMIN